MYRLQRIQMYNVCVANIICRINGTLYNDGRIVIDRDTFEFAGHLADDFILGHYQNGKYSIDYFFNKHENAYWDRGTLYLIQVGVEYEVNEVKYDLTDCKFDFYAQQISIEFKDVEYANKELISKTVQENSDLIDLKI